MSDDKLNPASNPNQESADEIKALLKEAMDLLSMHHQAHLITWSGGHCPICSKDQTEFYPNDIFGRIVRALSQ